MSSSGRPQSPGWRHTGVEQRESSRTRTGPGCRDGREQLLVAASRLDPQELGDRPGTAHASAEPVLSGASTMRSTWRTPTVTPAAAPATKRAPAKNATADPRTLPGVGEARTRPAPSSAPTAKATAAERSNHLIGRGLDDGTVPAVRGGSATRSTAAATAVQAPTTRKATTESEARCHPASMVA